MKIDIANWTCLVYLLIFGGGLAIPGCGEKTEPAQRSDGPSELGKSLLLAVEPAGAVNVGDVLQFGSENENVLVIGRIGGSRDPWVDSLAAFTLTDVSLVACNEIPEDPCPTPWDFCCEPKLAANTLLVQILSDDGELIEQDARKLLGVDELDTVVIEADINKDDAGNITLVAKKLFVRRSS